MPDTFTPILGLTMPEVGSSRDTWGSKTNANWTTLDTLVGIAMPIGLLGDYAGGQAPPGWLICDGRAISRTTYSDLFGKIGVAWGSGDGSTTFNLPPAQGRAMVAPGTVVDAAGKSYTYAFAQKLGTVAPVILQANLPGYNLVTDVQGWHAHGGATTNAGAHAHTTDAQGTHSHGGNTGWMSADHTHSGTTDTQGNHHHNSPWTGTAGINGAGGGPGSSVSSTGGGPLTSDAGAHLHNFSTGGVSANHYHAIGADGSHAHNVYGVGDHAHGINGDGNHQHNIWSGGSGAVFNVLNPVMVATKIIFAGKQAAPGMLSVEAMDAGMPMSQSDELTEIREQLAQLRMLLANTGRVLSSPSRGPH